MALFLPKSLANKLFGRNTNIVISLIKLDTILKCSTLLAVLDGIFFMRISKPCYFLFAKSSNSHKWDFSLFLENSFARFLCLKCAMEISAQKLEKVLLFLLSE